MARAIEEGRFSDIDRAALADEVRDLGKSERRELKSAIEVLLMLMLKSGYQPEKQTRSWQASIKVQRKQVAEFLKESPSLSPDLPQFINDAFERARIKAADETGLELDMFPDECEWSMAQVLESDAPDENSASKPPRSKVILE
jgi:hypothetical protein